MLCQKCHKNLATVRYAEVVDGRVSDLHLCPDCLAEHQKESSGGFEIAGGVRSPNYAAFRPAIQRKEVTCSSCGTRLSEVLESGVVGCETCYHVFGDSLELGGIALKARPHCGKSPRIDDARARVQSELQAKRAMLKTSLELERYEEAAELRDSIRALESELTPVETRKD